MTQTVAMLRSSVLATCLSLTACKRPPAPLTHEIYIWQGVWTKSVGEAVAMAKPDTAGFTPLAARISWHGNSPSVTWPEIPWQVLKGERKRVCAAIRVEPLSSVTASLPSTRETIIATARECVRRASADGVALDEIQLDFDAAESQLHIYTGWLRSLRPAVSPLHVTFTSLPCWLHQRDFKDLARASDGYVLQVHAAESPTPDSTSLCDPEKARQWVNLASRAAPGIPFRVALPTYTYEFAFAPDHSCIGVVADGEARAWPEDSQVVSLRADAPALATLRDSWNADRPAEFTGILWYRLPVSTDSRNWRWPTLRTLIRGGTPHPSLIARQHLDTEGKLCDLTLENTGDADALPPLSITVRWQNATCEACDPLSEYSMNTDTTSSVFHARHTSPANALRVIHPGESLALGWLRFSHPISTPSVLISPDEPSTR